MCVFFLFPRLILVLLSPLNATLFFKPLITLEVCVFLVFVRVFIYLFIFLVILGC